MKKYISLLIMLTISGDITAGDMTLSQEHGWLSAEHVPSQALYYALHERDIDTVIQSVSELARAAHTYQQNIRLYQEECTVLHIAFALGSSKLARTALDVCGDNMHDRDIDGYTPHAYNGIASHTHIHKPDIENIRKRSLRDKSYHYCDTLVLWGDFSIRQHLCQK